MKTQTLVVLIFLFVNLQVQGQDFAPIGSKWYYTNIESFFSPNQGFVTIENVGDTIIQGLDCKILEETEYRTSGDTIHKGFEYFYVSGDTVWRYADDEQFYILYNFSANIGDSWISKSYDILFDEDVEYEVSVDSIKTSLINGYNLKTMYYSTSSDYLDYGNGSVIQLLGGTWYMFPFNYAFLDGNIRIGLRCYSDPDFGQFNSGIADECDQLIITNVEELGSNDQIKVFPNPSTGEITIELMQDFEDFDLLNIYSTEGRLIKSIELTLYENKLSLELRKKGFYIVEVVGNEQRIIQKLIIK